MMANLKIDTLFVNIGASRVDIFVLKVQICLPGEGGAWPTNIRGGAAGKSKKLPCRGEKFLKMIPCPGIKFS